MNSPTSPICQAERINAFLDGELPEADLESFERHLEDCESCAMQLQLRTASDDFWDDTKRFLRSSNAALSGRDSWSGDASPSSSKLALEQATEHRPLTTLDLRSDAADSHSDSPPLSFLDPTDDPHMLGRFGGYEISGVIGSGGMGMVLKGWDRSLDRYVAIKVLHPSFAGQSASRKRFAREAQAAAAVLHDNVIAIYGVDQYNDVPYLVMPYIKGESLQQRIDRSAPLSIEEILAVTIQIARGLAAAHDQGLTHRDIKPANILMPSSVSRVIITDFGLARSADDASLTRSGVLAGTPQYMSPEQAKDDPIDSRSDLFSLGSVMYAMASGRPPFRADGAYAVLRKITDKPHRPLSQLRHDLPQWLETTIDRLLAKDPVARFQSAQSVADYLEDCLAHLRQPTTTVLPKPVAATGRRPGKRTWTAAMIVGIAVLVALFAFVFSGPSSQPSERSQSAAVNQPESQNIQEPTAVDVPTWDFDDTELSSLEQDLERLLIDTEASFPSLPAPLSE